MPKLEPEVEFSGGGGDSVLVMYNDVSGHEEQVPAVSRIAFGITSSDA